MSTTLPPAETTRTFVDVLSIEACGEVAAEVTASWHRSASVIYGRRTHRFPFKGSLRLRGLDENLEPTGERLIVTARDVSGDGISFIHDGPLPYRFVEVTLETPCGELTRRTKLTWCRYSMGGVFISGGRFLHGPVEKRPA